MKTLFEITFCCYCYYAVLRYIANNHQTKEKNVAADKTVGL